MLLALALLASLLGLAVGPVLFALGRTRALPLAALEGLSLGLVPSLVLLRVAPHLVEDGGGAAVACLILGYVALVIVERRSHRALATVGQVVAVPALALHAVADGAGLGVVVAAAPQGGVVWLLGAGILLHRVPEGLTLARALVPEIGWKRTGLWMGLLGSATVLGALVGQRILSVLPEDVFHAIVAVGVGAMVRLVTHSHARGPTTVGERAVAGSAFVAGIAAALFVPAPPELLSVADPQELSIAESFVPLLCATAPFVLGGVLITAALSSWRARRGGGGGAGGGGLRALYRAALEPDDHLGILERVREGLGRREMVVGAVFVAMAIPALDLARVPMTLRVLGLPVALARWILSGSIAMIVAVLVGAVATSATPRPHGAGDAAAPAAAARSKPAGFVGLALAELDRLAPWYLGGLVVACAIEALVGSLGEVVCAPPLDVILGAVIAAPAWLCPIGLAPVALVLVHKGASPGAALAGMLVGPAMSATLLATTWRRAGPKAAVVLGGTTLALGIGAGLLASWVLGAGQAAAGMPELHALVGGAGRSAVERVGGGVLVIGIVVGVMRAGPRVWVSALGQEAARHEHEHDSGGGGA